MIYNVGVEDIEPNHYVAWAFARPGLTGSGQNAEAAAAHLQMHLSNSEVHIAEVFNSYLHPDEPKYRVHAFFEDDKRPLSEAEIWMGLDEMLITRRDFLEQIEELPPDVLTRPILGEFFGSIEGIVRHLAQTEWWYCDKLGGVTEKYALKDIPMMEALAISRENTRKFLPTLADDTRVTEFLEEKWSARKILRRALWHERDHTRHIGERLRAMK